MRLASSLLVLFVLFLPAAAGEPSAPAPATGNVRIVLTVGEYTTEGSGEIKKYELLLSDDAPGTLSTGWKVPIPTTQFNTAASTSGAVVPMTSYSYQNIGMDSRLTVSAGSQGRIRVKGSVAVSAVDESGKPAPQPRVGSFEQQFSVLLASGKKTRVAQVPKPRGGGMFLDIEATRID